MDAATNTNPAVSGAQAARPQSTADLFFAFTALALQGFGGVLGVSQGVLCEKKRWLTNAEFVEDLALAQVLPGPNVCNLALIVGDRFFGWRGALAALAGLVTAPLGIVLAWTVLYAQYAHLPAVAGALRGMGAAAAGLIIGSTLKLVPALSGNVLRLPACIAIVALAFGAVAILRWPMIRVVALLGAAVWGFAWFHVTPAGRNSTGAPT